MSVSNKSAETDTQAVQVFLRIRPFAEYEQQISLIETLTSKELLVKASYEKKFIFDEIFGPKSKQVNVYKRVVKPYVADLIAGYNCTVFTYGQALTGKTYTMNGVIPSLTSSTGSLGAECDLVGDSGAIVEDSGLIPRVISDLFAKLDMLGEQHVVECTYLELYNEEVRDLFSTSDNVNHIRIYDDRRNKGGVVIQGMEEVSVKDKFAVFKLLKRSQQKIRAVSKLVNEKSGSSHTIFTINVRTQETRSDGEQLIKIGKLNLVDLAGGESINKISSVERRARQTGNTGQSLLTLGRVIKALSEKSSHVPFRESKLTRILQDSLGGKTKTAMIATIAPSASSIEETLCTLEYAQRARTIINTPEVTKKIAQKKLITRYVDEISRLRRDLDATRTGNGVYLDCENYEKILADLQNEKDEVSHQKDTVIFLKKCLNEQNVFMQVAVNHASDNTKRLSENKENIASLRERQTELCEKVLPIISKIKKNVNNNTNLLEEALNNDPKSYLKSFNTHCKEFKQSLASCQNWNNLSFERFVPNDEQSEDLQQSNSFEETRKIMSLCRPLFSEMEPTLTDKSNYENILTTFTHTDFKSDALVNKVTSFKENLQKRLKSRCNTITEHLTETRKQQLEHISKNQSIRENIKMGMTNLKKVGEENSRCNLNLLNKGSHLTREILDKENPCRQFLIEHVTEALSKNKILQENLSIVSHTAEASTERCIINNFNMYNAQKWALYKTVEDVHKDVMEKDAKVEAFAKLTEDFYQHSDQHNSLVLNEVQQLQSIMTSVDTNVSEVQHAGDTPVRTNYKHLHWLKELTPKEKALSRFREKRNLLNAEYNISSSTMDNRAMPENNVEN